MANSGVTVADEVVDVFSKMKLKQNDCKVMTLVIEGEHVVIEKMFKADELTTWEDFIEEYCKEDESRFILVDFPIKVSGKNADTSLGLLTWNPDTAKIKQKMVYSATKDQVKKKLPGTKFQLNCSDKSDINREELTTQKGVPKVL